MKRFPKLPPNLRVIVRHYHPNNSRGDDRLYMDMRTGNLVVSDYLTTAKIVDRETGEVLFVSSAICGANDQPSRKRGYQVAVGRVIAKYWKNVAQPLDIRV